MVQEFVLFVGDIIRSCLQEGQHEHGLVVCNQKNAPSPSPRGKAKQAEAKARQCAEQDKNQAQHGNVQTNNRSNGNREALLGCPNNEVPGFRFNLESTSTQPRPTRSNPTTMFQATGVMVIAGVAVMSTGVGEGRVPRRRIAALIKRANLVKLEYLRTLS